MVSHGASILMLKWSFIAGSVGLLVSSTANEGKWVEKVADQVPSLLILVVLMFFVGKYLESRDRLFARSLEKTTEALQENTKVLGKVVGVLEIIDLRKRRSVSDPEP